MSSAEGLDECRGRGRDLGENMLIVQKQALVFVNTKRGAESQAEKIAQKVKSPRQEEELEKIE